MKMPSFLRKGGFKPGAVEDFPAGSVDRAKALTVALVSSWSLASTTQKDWERVQEQVKKEQAAELLGFQDFDAYLEASIGKKEGEAAKRFEAKATKPGGDRKSEQAKSNPTVGIDSQIGRAKANGVSDETQRWLDRLAKDRPDLLDKVNAGELKPKTAARQAGIIHAPTNLEIAQKAYEKLTAEDKKIFRAWQQ